MDYDLARAVLNALNAVVVTFTASLLWYWCINWGRGDDEDGVPSDEPTIRHPRAWLVPLALAMTIWAVRFFIDARHYLHPKATSQLSELDFLVNGLLIVAAVT